LWTAVDDDAFEGRFEVYLFGSIGSSSAAIRCQKPSGVPALGGFAFRGEAVTVSHKREQKAKGGPRSESIRVRITPELRAAIEEIAAGDNRTLSSWIETALKRAVEESRNVTQPVTQKRKNPLR
jgi:predicted HicB family RNase H-like nuclease